LLGKGEEGGEEGGGGGKKDTILFVKGEKEKSCLFKERGGKK